MAKFSVDPSAAYRSLPKGEYNVMVMSAERKAPKQGEHDYILVDFCVCDGEYQNETFQDRLSLSPKAKARLASFVKACGLATGDQKGEMELDTDDFRNKFLSVRGEPETFKGFEKFRPTTFMTHPGVAAEQAKEMNAQAEAARTAAPPPPAAAPKPPTAPPKKVQAI